jgi:simple sugar transport system ATP-binding protein
MTGRDYHVLLAAQPTRGVDVGAIEFIHDQLRARARRGQGDRARLRRPGRGPRLVRPDRRDVRGRFATVLPRATASPRRSGPYMTGAADRGGGR